eukprot:TRINITY_DN1899_c0_g1_i1.p1 TRINITY_DN1899_c0_g1~~TRINITY_DN1899_c0_g1_i1.p1  ORF type:complete len:388 (-),score=76.37 TRINITY_DN1899_c0_g1_i1:44-1063(-)
MKQEVSKLIQKYELSPENEQQVVASMERCGDKWSFDLKELDHSLSRVRNPSSLLATRLRELEALRGFEAQAKSGHLPGCMCITCKQSSFDRAVGANTGGAETASLNAAALAAYQSNADGPSDSYEDEGWGTGGGQGEKGKGKGKPLVLPTGDLLEEVRAFCARFQVTDRLATKVMDTLRKRTDTQWRTDIAEMYRDLGKARNPSGLLVVKLGDIQKELNPNQLCFNYRAGTCTWGDKCRWSHDVATGLEKANSRALLASGSRGTVAANPTIPAIEGGGGGGSGGFGDGSGFAGGAFGSSKVDKLLRRKRARSSSSDKGKKERSRSRDGGDSKRKSRWGD